MRTIKLRITGMHCSSCETLIKDVLMGIEGVLSAEVSNGKGTAVVEYDGSRTDESTIKAAIRKDGYGVK